MPARPHDKVGQACVCYHMGLGCLLDLMTRYDRHACFIIWSWGAWEATQDVTAWALLGTLVRYLRAGIARMRI